MSKWSANENLPFLTGNTKIADYPKTQEQLLSTIKETVNEFVHAFQKKDPLKHQRMRQNREGVRWR